jgi:hypothetical protein
VSFAAYAFAMSPVREHLGDERRGQLLVGLAFRVELDPFERARFRDDPLDVLRRRGVLNAERRVLPIPAEKQL